MHRRTFLRTSTAAAIGGFAALSTASSLHAALRGAKIPARLGVQLYTVRDVFPNDFNGVLELIKRIGYDEVEFAGFHDRAPRAVRAVLDDIGLTAPSGHLSLEALQNDFDATVEAAQIVGHDYVIVPWLPEEMRTSLDDYRRVAETFNTLGERVKAAGMQFAYHNHDFEYETFGGDKPAYDVLLEETDPNLVAMQMDLFWTIHAGHDPISYFGRFPGRFHLFHVKDRTADGTMVDVGAGVIDFAQIFEHAEHAGLRHAVVEHDEPEDSLASIRASHDHLEQLRGS